MIGADVLRDAAGLATGHVGRADGVQQRSLTVIDVAHDGDHRRRAARGRRISSASSIPCVLSSSKLTLLVDAPKSRARSSAIFTSRFWLMVAKIFFSTSFLMTRLRLDAELLGKFLEVTPSEIVISRSMGGGADGLLAPRYRHPQAALFLLLVAMTVAPAWLP